MDAFAVHGLAPRRAFRLRGALLIGGALATQCSLGLLAWSGLARRRGCGTCFGGAPGRRHRRSQLVERG
ncbi:MAG: hypothetical protein ACRETB_00810, partial [Steroidobacteraceae bacterium]